MKKNYFSKKRYAKMWYKGISFTSDNMALTYLVDSAGTRTTTDSFTDLSSDYSLGVFYKFVLTNYFLYKQKSQKFVLVPHVMENTIKEKQLQCFKAPNIGQVKMELIFLMLMELEFHKQLMVLLRLLEMLTIPTRF